MNVRIAMVRSALSVALLLSTRLSFADPGAPDSCSLERAIGLTEVESQAVEEVVCAPLRASPQGKTYRVHAIRIGTKVTVRLVSLAADGGRTDDELVLSSIDELTVAAPRLREAAVEHKRVTETLDVTNVVGDESRKPKKRPTFSVASGRNAYAPIVSGGIAMRF